jgi:uncharacterized protein
MIRPACRRIDTTRSTAIEIVHDIDTPEPLVRGKPVTLRFSLTPHPVVPKVGERLRFDIASRTDLLRGDQSHDHARFDMQVPPYFSRNTVHYGPDTYSFLPASGSSRGLTDDAEAVLECALQCSAPDEMKLGQRYVIAGALEF